MLAVTGPALLALFAFDGLPAAQTPAPAAQTPAPPQPPPATRRSQRIKMTDVRVTSPDGRLSFALAPNAERLTFSVTLDRTVVIEPSPIVMDVDGYDLSTGVILKGEERYDGHETYAWYGAHSTATSDYRGARLTITNDLTGGDYTLDIRAFNDGVAFRHVVPGPDATSRVPDEYTVFTLPAGSG